MGGATMQAVKRYRSKIESEVAAKLICNSEFMRAIGLTKGNRKLTPILRKEIWKKFIDVVEPIQKKLVKDLSNTFAKQEIAALKKLGSLYRAIGDTGIETKAKDDKFFSDAELKKWVEEFAEISEPHIEDGMTAGATATLARLGSDIVFDPTIDPVQEFIKDKAFANSLMVNETTDKVLRKALADGLAEGQGVDQVKKRIKEIFEYSKESRARMIAQTEMIGAVNKGGIEGSKQSGVVWGNQWVGSLDSSIREEHEAMTANEEAVPLGETFSNGCEYPGDQGGDAASTINCRCTLLELTEKP